MAADLITDARLDDAGADAFRHREIAGRVAELAATTRTPCNIALYGPWGSGKSSFYHLLSDAISSQGVSAKVVRYDAWKFGGHALKRNFISNAADELDIHTSRTRRATSEFHGGLHQSKSSVALRPENIWRGGTAISMASYALLAAAAAVLLSATWAAVEVWATGDGFREAFKSSLRPIGTALMTAAGAVGLGLKIFETASVTVDQRAPSEDDQFDELFARLVVAGRKKAGCDTLIFFIDELDRCSKSDVVATLTSLRTFLDQQHCVFIVAADREVLEEALGALEQETPVRADEPYYSSASAFLDKIFQYQFALPPLRPGRLTGFARSLVIENTLGLWADLRRHDDGRVLDTVLYTLIPAHVRSPRRVKVLLNSFATNIRVAEARGVNWRARATEIAKLTVLQVEFPALAADLHLEPRLPTLLISRPAQPSDRQRMLLHRHGDPTAETRRQPQIGENPDLDASGNGDTNSDATHGISPPDRLLSGVDSLQLRRRQYEDLVRYLESRAMAPDPGRDLVYLEIAGAVVGIEDPDLGALIEDTAAVDPNRVLEGLEGRTEAERLLVAKALGRQSENEFGPEQQNVIRTLSRVVAGIDFPVLQDDIGDLAKQLRSYERTQGSFAQDLLAGVFAVGVAAGPDGADLLDAAIGSSDFYEDEINLEVAARALSLLDPKAAAHVAHGVALWPSDHPDITESVVRRESVEVVELFLRCAEDGIVSAFKPRPVQEPATPGNPQQTQAAPELASQPGPADASELLTSILTTLLDREESEDATSPSFAEVAVAFATTMLRRRVKGAYQAISTLADQLAEAATTHEALDKFALAGLACVSPPGWSRWAERLSDGSSVQEEAASSATRILRMSWEANNDHTEIARTAAPSTLDKVLQGRVGSHVLEDQAWGPILTALSDPVDLTTDASVADRAHLFDLVTVGISHDRAGELTASLIAATVDCMKATFPSRINLNDTTSDRLADLIDHLPTGALPALYETWTGEITDVLSSDPYYCRIELRCAGELARRAGAEVQVRSKVAHHVLGNPFTNAALSDWLATGPSAAELVDVLQELTSAAAVDGVRTKVSEWARRLDVDSRTTAVKLIAATSKGTLDPLVSEIAAQGVASSDLAGHFAAEMAIANSKSARQRVVGIVKRLRLETYEETRALAEQALAMLEAAESKAAVEDAAGLLGAIGNTHKLKAKIQERISELDGLGVLNDRTRRELQSSGYQVRKKKHPFDPLGIVDRLAGRS